jgi:hypothetical protein
MPQHRTTTQPTTAPTATQAPTPPPPRSTKITAEHLRALTVQALSEHLPLAVAGYRSTDADLYHVLVAAAVQQRSIESVAQQLVDAPSANLVRHYLADRLFGRQDLDALEARCNALLVARLPADLRGRRHRVAIDLTLLPYYGAPATAPGELRRGEAKAGTTRFHAYASAYVMRDGRRVTLALTFVWAQDDLLDVLSDLLNRVARLGIGIERLFLDRQFASVPLLTHLQQQPFTSVVALPKRGQRLKALLRGRRGYRTTYTMRSPVAGHLTFPVWVACHYAAGRPTKQGPKHGCEYQAFAVLGQPTCPLPVPKLAKEYRGRFGIETSYRVLHQVRARTTSREPALRLLLLTIAGLLSNLWVYCKTLLVRSTARHDRRAARQWLDAMLRLDRWRDLLLDAIKARYHVRDALHYPFGLTLSPGIGNY